MVDEAQRAKREAASSYDYESDPRWPGFWSNVLIPPNMASRSDVLTHFKHRFYQRYIDADLVLEPIMTSSSSSSSQQHRSSATTSSSSPPPPPSSSPPSPPSNAQARSPSSRNRSSGIYAMQAANPNPLGWDCQIIQLAINAWVFIMAVLAVIPLLPRNLSDRACRLSNLGTACSSLHLMYSLYGKPRAWTFLDVHAYFRPLIASKQFIVLIYSLLFVASEHCYKFALISIICWASEHVAMFLRRNFNRSTLYRKYLEVPCVWMESNNITLNTLTSHTEIALGFLLIISLFSWHGNILQTIMYWQLLKIMYHAPVTAPYHKSVWAKIGRTVNPFIHCYAPCLNTLISAVQRSWFS